MTHLLLLAFLLLFPSLAFAQAGYFSRANCAELTSPVANQTECLQTTTTAGRNAGTTYIWTGSAWVEKAAPGTIPDARIPELKDLTTGLTPGRCVETDGATGRLTATAGACGAGGGESLPIVDTTAIVKGSVDDTRLLRFEIDGFSTGQTRVLTPLNKSYTLEETGHGAKHQHGGGDEIGTATPGANAIPKAGAGGQLASGWIPPPANSSITAAMIDQSGNFTWTGLQDFAAQMRISGVIIPTSLSGSSTNNWAPTGLSTASVIDASADASHNVTGLTGGEVGRMLIFYNVGTFNITLVAESASSTAANRFGFNDNIVIAPNTGLILRYASSRWRVLSGAGGTSGGSFDQAGNFTLSGAWTFDETSSVDLSASTVTLGHGQLSGLTDGDPHTQYAPVLAAPGTPSAGAVSRPAHIYVDTTADHPYIGLETDGNFVSFGAFGDGINQVTNGTASETCTGNCTFQAPGGVPDKSGQVIQYRRKVSLNFLMDRDGGLEDTDDRARFFRAPYAMEITKICAITDTGTSTVNVQRNDGTPASIAASNITAATTEACTETFTSGENLLSEGHYLDFLMVTAAASGTPTQVTIFIEALIGAAL